jgi:hypothetical protein
LNAPQGNGEAWGGLGLGDFSGMVGFAPRGETVAEGVADRKASGETPLPAGFATEKFRMSENHKYLAFRAF